MKLIRTLRYKYTHSGVDGNFWNDVMSDRKYRFTRLQFYQMKQEDRSKDVFDNLDLIDSDIFLQPQNWNTTMMKFQSGMRCGKKMCQKEETRIIDE